MIGKINRKGFIQIPLLAGIIILIIVLSVGSGILLHTQEKSPSFLDNISETPKWTEKPIAIRQKELPEEPQIEQETETEETSQHQQELEQARLEVEKLKQETEKARMNAEVALSMIEAERLKKEKEEAKIKAEQEALFKIEKCKSEYIISKDKKLDELTLELLKFSLSAKKMEELAISECTQEGFAATEMDASTMSGQAFAGFMSMIRQQCEESISAQGEIEKFQSQKFTEIEQQLHAEYQQCIQR